MFAGRAFFEECFNAMPGCKVEWVVEDGEETDAYKPVKAVEGQYYTYTGKVRGALSYMILFLRNTPYHSLLTFLTPLVSALLTSCVCVYFCSAPPPCRRVWPVPQSPPRRVYLPLCPLPLLGRRHRSPIPCRPRTHERLGGLRRRHPQDHPRLQAS